MCEDRKRQLKREIVKGSCFTFTLILNGSELGYGNEEAAMRENPILWTSQNIMKALDFRSMELGFRSKSVYLKKDFMT